MGQTIQVTTAQNVQIDFNLASIGDRLLAGLLDLVFMFVAALLAVFLMGILSKMIGSTVAGFIVFLPVIFYSLISELITGGQTVGKRIMEIKTVKLDGTELTLGTHFMRWMFRLLDIWIIGIPGIIAIITIALSDKAQRLGDLVANTTVISLKVRSSIRKTSYVKVNKDYEATYPSVSQLIPSEIETIKEVLRLQGDSSFSVLRELSEKIESLLNIEKTEPARQFLIRVVKDFNYYESVRAAEALDGFGDQG